MSALPGWYYIVGLVIALILALGIAGVMEGKRSFKGLKPPVDSGK